MVNQLIVAGRALRTNLENISLRACWVGKRDVFKFHQTIAYIWSLCAISWVFGIPVQILKNLLSSSHSLHEARVHRCDALCDGS